MVGRIYKAGECIEYKKGVLSNYPVLKLKLYNMLGREFYEELEVPVDTGFEGSLMLESDDYKFFIVGELPKEYWSTYSTLTGSILMRVASAFAVIGNIKLKIYVETPYLGRGKRLLGREVLNKLVLVLDGIKSRCYVAKYINWCNKC